MATAVHPTARRAMGSQIVPEQFEETVGQCVVDTHRRIRMLLGGAAVDRQNPHRIMAHAHILGCLRRWVDPGWQMGEAKVTAIVAMQKLEQVVGLSIQDETGSTWVTAIGSLLKELDGWIRPE